MKALGTPKAGRDAARKRRHRNHARASSRKSWKRPRANWRSREAAELGRDQTRVCLMCLEHDWQCCHRAIVAERLKPLGLKAVHLSPEPALGASCSACAAHRARPARVQNQRQPREPKVTATIHASAGSLTTAEAPMIGDSTRPPMIGSLGFSREANQRQERGVGGEKRVLCPRRIQHNVHRRALRFKITAMMRASMW